MKCRKCGEVAVMNMRQHKLSLCSDHFAEWVPAQVEKSIRKYRMFTPEDLVLVAVSGGKDSYTLLDLLWRARRKAPVRFELVAFHLDQSQPDQAPLFFRPKPELLDFNAQYLGEQPLTAFMQSYTGE